MTQVANDVPIGVHIVSTDAQAPAPRREEYRTILRSVILTADEPAKQLVPPNPNLERLIVTAFTNEIVLSRTKGDAQAAGNLASSITNPNGTLLATGYPYDIGRTTSEMWASTGTYPTIVSVIATYCE